MYNDQEKKWMAAISTRKIQHYGEFALLEALEVKQDQNMRLRTLPFAVMSIGENGEERHYAILLDVETFLTRLHKFQALVYQLAKHDLIEIASDGRGHAVNKHPGWDESPYNNPTYHRFYAALVNRMNSRSRFLDADKKGELDRESFISLPKLESYIANGYRTQDQLEHDELKSQAREARDDAKRANNISIALAIGTVVLGLASVGLQWYSVTSTTKVDINSLPSTTRDRPSFPQLQPR